MTRRVATAAWSLVLCGIVLAAPTAQAAVYEIRPGEPNLVRFESKAPMESFDGRTRRVQGVLTLNPADLRDSVDMTVEVDLKTLDTGIPLRNEHMRKNHLETDRFPNAVFRIRRLIVSDATALVPNLKVTLRAEGDFTLHGVTQRIQVPVDVTRLGEADGGGLRIAARFQVLLPDYQIARPKFLALKLDEMQRVSVDLLAVPRP